MNTEVEVIQVNGGPSEISRPTGFDLTFAEMRERVTALSEFYSGVMQRGTDYDVIPGTQKPCLLQPGAQLLDGIFGLVPTLEELPSTIRDWERGFFAIAIRCRLLRKADGGIAAEGLGSCNSKEDRYRWRKAPATCLECGKELRLAKDRPEWYCWAKQGGCGATYPRDQIKAGGRVENDDPYSLENTILKMAAKRAHVAATLNATGANRIFTQDVEDLPPLGHYEPAADAPEAAPAQPARPTTRGTPAAKATKPVAAPEPTAESTERLVCETCQQELGEIRFRDGTAWLAAQLASLGRRKHGRVLCMEHYREANKARRRVDTAPPDLSFDGAPSEEAPPTHDGECRACHHTATLGAGGTCIDVDACRAHAQAIKRDPSAPVTSMYAVKHTNGHVIDFGIGSASERGAAFVKRCEQSEQEGGLDLSIGDIQAALGGKVSAYQAASQPTLSLEAVYCALSDLRHDGIAIPGKLGAVEVTA